MEKNIYLAGIGGQGLQLAGKVLVSAADKMGYNATYSPRYGFEKRGGLTSCYLVISDEKIGNPRKSKQDILFLMEQKAYNSFCGCVKDTGTLVINQSMITRDIDKEGTQNVMELPFYDCCKAVGNMKVISSVVAGAVTALMPAVFSDVTIVEDCLLEMLNSKPSLLEINRKAFRMGVGLVGK